MNKGSVLELKDACNGRYEMFINLFHRNLVEMIWAVTANIGYSRVVPVNVKELKLLVEKHIEEYGLDCSLNHIDVSRVTKFNGLFKGSRFNGSISKWDVSNAESMVEMFSNSAFNGDISNWRVSKVKDMRKMFYKSDFNGDIGGWNVSNVSYMDSMFEDSPFNGDISHWYTWMLESTRKMFRNTPFDDDISRWPVRVLHYAEHMFEGSPFKGDLSGWCIRYICNPRNVLRGSELESKGFINVFNVSCFDEDTINEIDAEEKAYNIEAEESCVYDRLKEFFPDISREEVRTIKDINSQYYNNPKSFEGTAIEESVLNYLYEKGSK